MNNAQLNAMRRISEPEVWNESSAEAWPNNLGWNVSYCGQTFEVWCDGRMAKTIANDRTPCGFERTHFARHDRGIGCAAEARVAVIFMAQRPVWTPIE